ncbi:MAG: FAD-binding protein [Gammaproteobacteria bacterium]|nr:FAD-binding protein [Gammaproteobacteria bacterium]
MEKSISFSDAIEIYRATKERPLPDVSYENLLEKYHPDYYQDSCVTLNVGVNKGEICHAQLAELLQADARIDEADLAGAPVVDTDLLVIGGGGAGCAAALTAAESGISVMLATKLRLGDSNTIMAEGGIQVSINKNDTPQQHFEDTIKSGHRQVENKLVAEMVMSAPDVVRWLIQQGMQFDLDEYGDLLTRQAGGTSVPRVAYFRDYTGLEMMRVLKEAVRSSSIEVLDYTPTVELLTNEDGHCTGAVLSSLQENRYKLVRAKAVVIATGGIGRLHINNFPTSNHFGATGDGLTLAYRLGAKLRDLDSFQYHPSGLAYPQHLSGSLVTEGVRSAGAYLLNAKGDRFIDELLPRDKVCAAIMRECAEGRGIDAGGGSKGVWLDTPGLELKSPGIFEARFPKLIKLGHKSGADPRKKPLLIYPTLHYQNGGVVIDEHGRTNVKGLYCVGEVSGGIHGRNRLMGNSLLEIICFGRRAGAHIAKNSSRISHGKITIEHLSRLRRELTLANMPMDKKCPILFPDYAKFETDSDYSGLHKNIKDLS